MPTTATAGLILLGIAFVGLFIEYVWREAIGRPTVPMLLFYALMYVPIFAGLFLAAGYFGWHWTIRLVIAVAVGIPLFNGMYVACGAVYHLFKE